MRINVKLEGIKEIDELLRKLPDSLSAKIIESANRAAVKPLIEKAKANAPEGNTGNLVDSIGIASRVKGGATIKASKGLTIVGPRRGKGKGQQGHHAHLVEYGTAERVQKSTGKSTGSISPGKPFMKPAWISTQVEVRKNIKEELGKSVIRTMKKTVKKAGGSFNK